MPVSLDTWIACAAATVILLLIPGPTILTVISYSLTHGRRANVALVAGVALGDSTAFVLSLVGLGAQLWVFAVTFVVLATVNAALYAVFAASARRFLSSPKSLRVFNVAGGSLLTAAAVWALFARRNGAA